MLRATLESSVSIDKSSQHAPFIVIEPPRHWLEVRLGELWIYRDLFYTLSLRDIKVRYKQTVLGAAWVIVQPLTGMIVFTVVFSKMANLSTDNIPAPLFYYSGLLAWTFFSQTVSGASQSLIEGSRLISKVYFPRIMIPASAVGYTLLNLIISMALMVPLMLYYRIVPSATLLLLPLLMMLLLMAALGIGILIAALNVKYRDFRYVVPFMLQVWMFATPVVYPADMIPVSWRWFASLNPMVGMVNGFRASLLGLTPDWTMVGISAAVSIIILIFGVAYFRRAEDEMADIL